MLVSLGVTLSAQSQPPIRILNPTNPSPMPGDARMNQFEDEPKGTSWRVFSVNSYPDGPVSITQVGEVRQFNPPSSWSVHLTSRALMPINSVTLSAAVVDVSGNIKAVQALPAIKNLKPGQSQRRETRIRTTVIAPTDRVVFYISAVMGETGDWLAAEADVAELIRAVAARLPVP